LGIHKLEFFMKNSYYVHQNNLPDLLDDLNNWLRYPNDPIYYETIVNW